jgi:co-chaperonin GroES (HSP10)
MSEKITLRPMSRRVIVEVEDSNPHRKQKTDSGIIIPDSKIITNLYDKEENGIVDGGEQRIKYAVVQAVAVDCIQNIKVGDQVVVDAFAGLPVAMGIPSLILIPESAILYIIDVTNE